MVPYRYTIARSEAAQELLITNVRRRNRPRVPGSIRDEAERLGVSASTVARARAQSHSNYVG